MPFAIGSITVDHRFQSKCNTTLDVIRGQVIRVHGFGLNLPPIWDTNDRTVFFFIEKLADEEWIFKQQSVSRYGFRILPQLLGFTTTVADVEEEKWTTATGRFPTTSIWRKAILTLLTSLSSKTNSVRIDGIKWDCASSCEIDWINRNIITFAVFTGN
jgi:hypothetical protein